MGGLSEPHHACLLAGDAAIAGEAVERAIPVLVAVVASELPAAAQAAGVDASAPELAWSLTAVGEQPAGDTEAKIWWTKQDTVVVPPGPTPDGMLLRRPPVSYVWLRGSADLTVDPDARIATVPRSP